MGGYRLSPQNIIFDKIHFRAFKSALEIKVGCNMTSSGNFISNEHKNILILLDID